MQNIINLFVTFFIVLSFVADIKQDYQMEALQQQIKSRVILEPIRVTDSNDVLLLKWQNRKREILNIGTVDVYLSFDSIAKPMQGVHLGPQKQFVLDPALYQFKEMRATTNSGETLLMVRDLD